MNRILAAGLWLVALGTPAASLAAQDIAGVVLASGSEAPIPYAQVTLVRTDGTEAARGMTHDDGRFLFRSVALGRYELVANRIGYREGRRADVVVPVPEGAPLVAVEMEPIPVELDGITVEVVRDRIWMQDVDLAGIVLRRNLGETRLYDRQQLDSYGYRELGSVLRPVAGLTRGSFGGDLAMARGTGTCSPILWYLDGRRLPAIFAEDVIPVEIESLLPEEVSAVEVNRRGECALWIWRTEHVRRREAGIGGGRGEPAGG